MADAPARARQAARHHPGLTLHTPTPHTPTLQNSGRGAHA